MPKIRPVKPQDADRWLALRCELWQDGTAAEHQEEIELFFAGRFPRKPWLVLVAETESGEIVGLAEVGIREYAEGCRTTPVAYLEGLFVSSTARRHGVARALVMEAEKWGRDQGCSEIASDCAQDNEVSGMLHLGLGFKDAGAVRCFHKTL